MTLSFRHRLSLYISVQIVTLFLVTTISKKIIEYTGGVNWALSAGWVSLLIIPLILTGSKAVKAWERPSRPRYLLKSLYRSEFAPFASIVAVAIFGFVGNWISHYNADFKFQGGSFMPMNCFDYAFLGIICCVLDYKWMARICAVIVIFGVAMMVRFDSLVIGSLGEAYWWKLGQCILYALLLIEPIARTFRDAPAQTQDQQHSEIRHYQKAA